MATQTESNLNLNLTSSQGIQPLFQAALNRHILARAKANLVHHQFGQKVKIPKGKTKTITWDKLSPLPLAKTPLTEGITPKGNAITITRVTGTPQQYGAYISYSDEVDFFKYDPSPEVLNHNELLADNAGETQDSLTSDILSTGTNVQYAGGKSVRSALGATNVLTVDEIRKAVRTLKGNKAKPIDGKNYVAIIDSDLAYDIQSDSKWVDIKTYSDPKDIYSGEIGTLYGVRFVETTNAAKFIAPDLIVANRNLSVKSVSSKTITLNEAVTANDATALVGRKILIGTAIYKIASAASGAANAATITCTEDIASTVAANDVIYPGEAGALGKPIHTCLVIGKDAYGVSDPKENLNVIMKPLGSAGSADPLNQRGTHGWKAHHIAKILTDEYMVRIEAQSTRDA